MFAHYNWPRFRIGRILIFAIVATTIISLTAAGPHAAVFLFMDSIKILS
jgi:hypothetical protein